MVNNELWEAALAQVQFHISKANFATWLKNTYILERKESELIISVPNSFSKEWLENKYNKLIFRILHELDGEIKEVKYTVERAAKKRPAAPPPTPRIASQEAQMDFQALNVDRTTNLNPRYTLESYIVGPFNELAHAAVLGIIKNPGLVYNPLFIYGSTGLGKTHLLQAAGNRIAKDFPRKKIKYISSEAFTSNFVSAIQSRSMDSLRATYREADVFILDDVQFLSGKEKTQEELFHVFNTLYEKGKQIIFSSDRPPKAIPALEERLRSRFEGGMVADISAPDYETRLAILKSKAQELGLEITDEIYEYLANNIQRNIRELEGALNRLLASQRLTGKDLALAEAKTLLRSIIHNPSKAVNPKKIMAVVAEFYDIKEKDFISTSRKKEIVRPRQIAMYLLREELKSSYPFIGKKFRGKDHTTAIYACAKVSKEIEESEFLADEINLIKQRIYSV